MTPRPIRCFSENGSWKRNSSRHILITFLNTRLVTFREDLPYAVAKEKGNAQDRLLMEICSRVESADALDLDAVMRSIRELSAS